MKLYYNQNRKRHSIRHSRQDLHPRLFPSRKRRDNTCVPTKYFLYPLYIHGSCGLGRFVRGWGGRRRERRAFVPTMYCFGTTNKQKTAILHQVDWHRVRGFTMRIFGRHGPTNAFSMVPKHAC